MVKYDLLIFNNMCYVDMCTDTMSRMLHYCSCVQDVALVEDCLRENNNDIELAMVEVLQLMCLADDSGSFPSRPQLV